MVTTPVIVCLPIADRQTSFTFYRDGLDFLPIGEVADDGVPEPLQFVLNDGVRLMLIPTGGFGWVIGDREVATPGSSEDRKSTRLNSSHQIISYPVFSFKKKTISH